MIACYEAAVAQINSCSWALLQPEVFCGPQGPAEAPSRHSGNALARPLPAPQWKHGYWGPKAYFWLIEHFTAGHRLWFKEIRECFRNSSMSSDCKNVFFRAGRCLCDTTDCLLLSRTAIWLFLFSTVCNKIPQSVAVRSIKELLRVTAEPTGLKQQHFFTVIMWCTDPELNSFISVWNTASEPVYNQCGFLSHWVSLRMRSRSHPSAELNLW